MSTPNASLLATIGPDTDRAAQLASCYFIGCGISFIFVALRFWARSSIRGIGADDWCMLATWIIFFALCIIVGFIAFNGGTRHFPYLMQDPKNAMYVVKLNWIAQPFGIFSLGLGKVAIALLLVRLLDRSSFWRKWILYVTSVWTMINSVLMCLFTFVQCRDPRALWDLEVKARTKCWNPYSQSDFSIYGSSAYAFMDFLLALLPITLIYGLKLEAKKKIALCIFLGCGCLTGIFAAIKTSTLVTLTSRSDLTWYTLDLYIWTGIELALLIVCGSVPTLKPIYDRFKKNPASAKGSRTYGYDNSYGKSKNSYLKATDLESSDAFPLGSHGSSVGATSEYRAGAPENIRVTKTFAATWDDDRSRRV